MWWEKLSVLLKYETIGNSFSVYTKAKAKGVVYQREPGNPTNGNE